jgi:hypothetical protein
MAEKEVAKVDSKERVALELMREIAHAENYPYGADPRTYYLSLYRQCYLAADGYGLDRILGEVPPPKHQQ